MLHDPEADAHLTVPHGDRGNERLVAKRVMGTGVEAQQLNGIRFEYKFCRQSCAAKPSAPLLSLTSTLAVLGTQS